MASLSPPKFIPLAPGVVRPEGWLRRQLQIQADGLMGHLDEIWPDVADSAWIGGQAEGWERGPYWLDGIVPLAYILDDERLIDKVKRWIDYILVHQQENGWLGPVQDERYNRYKAYDPWPVFVTLKALTQYQEATADERVIPAITRFMHWLNAALDENPLFSWGKMRWADLVLCIHWLYEHTGEPWLLDLADKAHVQGTDWLANFENFQYTTKTAPEDCTLITHVVNNAMAIKTPGIWWRQSGETNDREGAKLIVDTLDHYHGQATGVFTGDEHLAGKNPSQGTELCAVVEYMYSLEVLSVIQGDAWLQDRLEKITFNALPATYSPDMWSHQYDQQANQAIARIAEDRIYTSNGADANIYGLEPNFGCCTANGGQGWPKFAAQAWMSTPDGGLVCQSLVPSTLETTIDESKIQVVCESEYPFRNSASIRLNCSQEGNWPLLLRMPGWANDVRVLLDGQAIEAKAGTYLRLERDWQGEHQIEIILEAPLTISRRFNGAVSVERGPLVFALKIGEEWVQVRGEKPTADYEVHPTTPWAYALVFSPELAEGGLELQERPVGEISFSPEGAPLLIRAQAKRVTNWGLEHNAAAAPPSVPTLGLETETIELLPYGCTNLRITEMPMAVTEDN